MVKANKCMGWGSTCISFPIFTINNIHTHTPIIQPDYESRDGLNNEFVEVQSIQKIILYSAHVPYLPTPTSNLATKLYGIV